MADNTSLPSGFRLFSGEQLNAVLVKYTQTGALPTTDPHVKGALWNNSGTITVSAG